MNKEMRILCPVDLSDNSLAAVELATALAQQYSAKIIFCYVSPKWLPEESMVDSEYLDAITQDRRNKLEAVRPTQANVEFETLFLNGSPGPELVKVSESCDMVVMATHGFSGVMRFIMGSVAEYVTRHAECPVILSKNPELIPQDQADVPGHERPVVSVMHQVAAVQGDEKMPSVVKMMQESRELAVPTVNAFGKCIGILSRTDVKKYQELLQRYEAGDQTVIPDFYETDVYGQRRTGSEDFFHQVSRHMTAPVVTICSDASCRVARETFAAHPLIHQLVVVDQKNRPVGILEKNDVVEVKQVGAGQ